jgi:hypothetical protein
MLDFSYKNITLAAPTTTLVKSGAGILHSVVINKAVANSVITIYDGLTAAAGTLIGTVTLPATLLKSQDVLDYDVAFKVGLCIVTATGASDLTISYK